MKNELTAKRMQLALSNANMIPQDLAEKSGVSKSSISQYVNGSHAPSNISSGKMGKVLGVNPLWLMGFDVDMKESIISESLEEIEKEKFDKYIHIVDKYHFISTHSPDGAGIVDTILDRECAIAKKLEENKKRIEELENNIATEKKIVNYPSHVSEDIPDHLIVQAAHNDAEIDEEELENMKSDIEQLKKLKNKK